MNYIATQHVTVAIGDGATPENFLPLTTLHITQLDILNPLHPTTHVGTSAWRSVGQQLGTSTARMSAEGKLADADAATQRLRHAAFAQLTVNLRVQIGAGEIITGAFYPTSLTRSANTQTEGVANYRCVLESAGAMTLS